MKLELYYKAECPYCQKVLNYMMDNCQIKDVQLVDIKEGNNNEDLIKRGGKDQVPCLFIDGKALYESDDIIKYFKENF
ncbi:glutaredoxin family protein [Fenollaria massiliensis]|uniref:Glutathione S-transferase N-terminal domain-containing protein n=1 Tax=Fenollaria massiliensis TaxID=938288 RepID=A0A9E7DJP7_9FIRM|nr:glutathione S-transferase N-terminal domain-containing protein [Fenollaria massiliensis]UQK59442.1 glutathione S-transferase N-terminal domain-containing protein [Fenollaria massiliensis]